MRQVVIAIDQVFNTLLAGYADETLSARAYRMKVKGHNYWKWTADFIDLLFFWEDKHCYVAYVAEIKRRQLPVEYRQ